MSERQIQALEARLRAVANRELWPLSPSEQARAAVHATRAGVAVQRGKAPRADRALDRVFEGAARRIETDLAALRQIEARRQQAAVDARVARRTKGGQR